MCRPVSAVRPRGDCEAGRLGFRGALNSLPSRLRPRPPPDAFADLHKLLSTYIEKKDVHFMSMSLDNYWRPEEDGKDIHGWVSAAAADTRSMRIFGWICFLPILSSLGLERFGAHIVLFRMSDLVRDFDFAGLRKSK